MTDHLSLVGRAGDVLEQFFALAERPAWRDSWHLAFRAESLEQVQTIWTELMAETWRVVQSSTLPRRREWLLARIIYEAAHQEPALVFFPPEAAGQIGFQRVGGGRDSEIAIAVLGPVQWILAEEFGGAYLALWCQAGTDGRWRHTLRLSSLPGQLWRWRAYKDVEQGGEIDWPATCLARYSGGHAFATP